MKTANKLAQIAKANQQKTEANTCKCSSVALPSKGLVNQLVSSNDFGNDAGNRGTTQSRVGKAVLQDCLKCTSCGHSWIPEKNTYEQFEKKVRWGSHQYVRYVIKRCKELASKGYGSVEIAIDKTTDMFGIDEGRNSCYSEDFVCKLLSQEGFTFDYDEDAGDHYDAVSGTLIWDKSLPKSPESIGMCWE